MDFNIISSHLEFHIFFTQVSSFTWLHFAHTHSHCSLTHLHMNTYTLHITHYTLHILGAVTHIPNHQRRTYTHHITHRRHLGIPMTTLGLRRPGEQVSTLTSGICPPPGFPPNALRVVTVTWEPHPRAPVRGSSLAGESTRVTDSEKRGKRWGQWRRVVCRALLAGLCVRGGCGALSVQSS
ncbi:hypothetical protein Taro_012729 [Colocasia esculenta]|uniref:Uncharacterized protein n=1 Tax=Colocasia esculenta TaxID=4460 RepID=A0A843U4R0_COLES|nr:hypothetical protein [Colocasia esculenta]